MLIVLVSNYLNHHMLPLCFELDELSNHHFRFVATSGVPEFRKELGYKEMNALYDFVIEGNKDKKTKQETIKLCNNCDVLIYGSAPYEFYIGRLLRHKLTFRYSERVLKRPFSVTNTPKRFVKFFARDAFTQYKYHYLLSASAFAAYDFYRFGAFKNRALKWGYFPQCRTYEIENLISRKKKNSILWAGRMISFKKPLLPVEVAYELRELGVEFNMTLIGGGELYDEVNDTINKNHLSENVALKGTMSTEEVREQMEQSEIFLFTSNEEEGWGAVLNEAMNSGCVAIAYSGIGAVPFLVRDGENGIMFQEHNAAGIAQKCKTLFDQPELLRKMGKNAYETIYNSWNAAKAAERLIKFVEGIGSKTPIVFEDGPLSKAPILKIKAKE